jgi:hypothetical protein
MLMRNWFPKDLSFLPRPVFRSDFNNQADAGFRTTMRGFLSIMILRELPIKRFYTRCIIMYFAMRWFVFRGVYRGNGTPLFTYANEYHMKDLTNYPDLYWLLLHSRVPTLPPTNTLTNDWRKRQQPTYHLYHSRCYRYRFRSPRYLPWDGTMNQPTLPFLRDEGTTVINGTFKVQANTDPKCH